MRRLALFVATGAYSGYFPFAPGTVGSAVGLLVYGLVRWRGDATIEAVALVVATAAGCWAAADAERHFGREDPGQVVIDEVVGMLVTVAFLPVGWMGAVVGFFVFRILDIIKPYPALQFEDLPGGFGIMADDVMAGVYGNLLLRLAGYFWPGLVFAS